MKLLDKISDKWAERIGGAIIFTVLFLIYGLVGTLECGF